MHSQSISAWRHEHVFLGADHARNERRTWIVIGLTVAMMTVEIAAGLLFGSMALLADGVHMATHAAALSIAAAAYRLARRRAGDARFSFGTGKLGSLAGFSSALLLALVALLIAIESVLRLTQPIVIQFDEAIAVAVLGLIVNLVSAVVLQERTEAARGDGLDATVAARVTREADAGGHRHHDHNLRAAYLHVMSDALTSLLAIVTLVAGRAFGWVWMDPLMGIVGSLVIARWSWELLRGAGAVLLDVMPDATLSRQICTVLEQNGDRVADLHLWRIGPGHLGLIVAIVSDHPQAPSVYKAALQALRPFSHVTVEVHHCDSGVTGSGG